MIKLMLSGAIDSKIREMALSIQSALAALSFSVGSMESQLTWPVKWDDARNFFCNANCRAMSVYPEQEVHVQLKRGTRLLNSQRRLTSQSI